jgi:SAM-dependent methyltransferase
MRKTLCWCGNQSLDEYSPEYWICHQCGTLVLKDRPDDLEVVQDEGELYSKDYYLRHVQEDYGFPSLEERARKDLTERVLHWARTLLKYKLPPARVLELGSAHGGFVAMLRQMGYDATGLELSPWLVQYARDLFDIPMLRGPVETQQIPTGSLDAVVLMDVLEHLPYPVETMKHIHSLLKEDGIVVVQMPSFPYGKSWKELQEEDHPFLFHYKPREHLFLFSKAAAQNFFRRVGFRNLQFEQPIFSKIDMFFVAGKEKLPEISQEERDAALLQTPSRRFALALLDLYTQYEEQAQAATERLEVINKLDAHIKYLQQVLEQQQFAGQAGPQTFWGRVKKFFGKQDTL